MCTNSATTMQPHPLNCLQVPTPLQSTLEAPVCSATLLDRLLCKLESASPSPAVGCPKKLHGNFLSLNMTFNPDVGSKVAGLLIAYRAFQVACNLQKRSRDQTDQSDCLIALI